MMILKPPALRKNDLIHVVSPSSAIAAFPRRLQRGIDSLQSCGFKVSLSAHAQSQSGTEAGTSQQRAQDLMSAFQNPDIRCIIASTGGYTSNTVLEYLDFSIIRGNPKIFLGFSDITALLNVIHSKTELATFHGPTLLPSFGDVAGVHADTFKSFMACVSASNEAPQPWKDFSSYSDDNLFWDKEDHHPREYKPSEGLLWLTPGSAIGPLVGGNLDTLLSLLPTPYAPDFKGKILLLEEAGGSISKTMRDLKTIEQAGIFQCINGLVFGRPYAYRDMPSPYGLADVLRQLGKKYDLPVLHNFPFGHTEPKHTLALGISTLLDANKRIFRQLESAVA